MSTMNQERESFRGTMRPAPDERKAAEDARRARRQAEAIDAEYEMVSEAVSNLPARTS